jgi:uncharacterized protein
MSSDRFFFVRLVGPRASFLQDMTDDERAIMKDHGEYWRGQLAAGKVIVFGPVADPKGAWGLGVLRVQDEAEIASFQANDPAIKRIPGMRYEVLPMLTAVFAS